MIESVKARRLRQPEYWLCLCAVCLVGICYYGIRAAAVIGLAAVTAVLTDFICLFLRNKSYKMPDLSNAAAAVVMVLMFPATIPYSIVILSTVFTVAVGIHVFGSRGDYLFPPPAVGYLFALICWKNELLQFPPAGESLALFGNDAVALHESLSSAVNADGYLRTELLDLLLGTVYTPMGTGCLMLLLVALVIMIARKCVSAWGCLGYAFGITMFAAFGSQPPIQMFIVNMVLFSMIFLVGDIAMMPQGRLTVFIGALVTGMLTSFLVIRFQLEYAPVIAVMLSSPVWLALAKVKAIADRIPRKQITADQASADVPSESKEDA